MEEGELKETYLHFAVNSVTSADLGGGTAIVAPAGTLLTIRTVTGHVPSVTTNATNDTSGVVLLLRTVVLAVADLAAILASLVLVISKGTVQRGQLTQLVALELVLAFGDGSGLELLATRLQW